MHGEAVEDRSATLVDVGVGLWLIAVQVILFSLMWAEGDPFDSRLFWWSWLILPVLALLATIERPWGARPFDNYHAVHRSLNSIATNKLTTFKMA